MNLYKYNKKTLKLEKVPLSILLAIISIGIFVSGIVINGYNKKTPKKEIIYIGLEDFEWASQVHVISEVDEFTEEKLAQLLLDLNVKFPDIVFAQARYESGNWGNNPGANIFETNNNLFGMKIATQRPTTNIGIYNKHAVYNNWRMSVIDYALWQANMTTGLNTRENYMAFLKRRYAEGTYVSIEQITKHTQKKYPQLFVKKYPALEKVKVTIVPEG